MYTNFENTITLNTIRIIKMTLVLQFEIIHRYVKLERPSIQHGALTFTF